MELFLALVVGALVVLTIVLLWRGRAVIEAATGSGDEPEAGGVAPSPLPVQTGRPSWPAGAVSADRQVGGPELKNVHKLHGRLSRGRKRK